MLLSWVVTVALFLGVVWMFTDTIKLRLRAEFERQPRTIWFWPTLVYFLHVCYLAGLWKAPNVQSLWLAWLLFMPTLMLWRVRFNKSPCTWWDIAALLAIVIPIEFRWAGKRFAEGGLVTRLPLSIWSTFIMATVCWSGLRGLGHIKLNYSLTRTDLAKVFAAFAVLFVVLLGLGISLGFLQLKPVSQMQWWMFPLYVLGVSIAVGLGEEFIFRGLLQNMLGKLTKRPYAALVVTSVLFGLAHLNKVTYGLPAHELNWRYALMAAVASLGYGWTYNNTRSLLCPILLHCMVDAAWLTLFIR